MNSSGKRLVVCGLNHQTSTVEEREPLQIGPEEIAHANTVFVSLPQVQEGLIVSTCNRVEFYFVTRRDRVPFEAVAEFYQKLKKIDISDRAELFETRVATHAVEHLFRVASGIDSMVIGETQIFGQIKDAYASACAVSSAGKVIHRLFHQAFRVGKQVRSDTEMGKGACSVSSAAVELLKTKFGTNQRPAILFIGVNQMIKLAASRCRRIHHSTYLFANRTADKAVSFAERFESDGFGLEKLPELVGAADVVISCTGSPSPIVDRAVIEGAMSTRPERKLVILDLAIPRDVDCPKEGLANVELLDLEDIKTFVARQKARREDAIPQVEQIIEHKLEEFNYWWRHVKELPLYNGKADQVDAIVEDELVKLLEKCPPELRNELNLAARRIADRAIRAAGGNANT